MKTRWLCAAVFLSAALLTGCSAPQGTITPPREDKGDFSLTDKRNDFAHAAALDYTPFTADMRAMSADRYKEIRDAVRGKSVDEIRDSRTRLGFSVRELVTATLTMIKDDEYFRSVMQLDPTALEQASGIDESTPEGPLSGTVALVKGNIAVKGLRNDAGSGALADRIADEDAPAVARLRAAGVVILGRANLSEFANYLSERTPNGFSAMGGQTLSPSGPLTIDPLGSSSGSAVAVQLGIVPVALGTETSGSIISPAEVAGVIGYRAGSHHWPQEGIVPLDSQLDAAGVLARTLKDAEYVDAAISGTAPASALTKVILAPDEEGWDPQTAIRALEAEGLEVVTADKQFNDAVREAQDLDPQLLQCGFAQSVTAFLTSTPGKVRSIQDLDAWYTSNQSYAPYGHDLVTAAADTKIAPEACANLHRKAAAQVEAVGDQMRRLGAEALVGTNGSTAFVTQNGSPRVTLPGVGGDLIMNGTSSADSANLLKTAQLFNNNQIVKASSLAP